MISLVSILMVVSMFCSMVTDVQFYIDKLRDKHSTFKGEIAYNLSTKHVLTGFSNGPQTTCDSFILESVVF